eukprot:3941215-Rhodomonas_salina.1
MQGPLPDHRRRVRTLLLDREGGPDRERRRQEQPVPQHHPVPDPQLPPPPGPMPLPADEHPRCHPPRRLAQALQRRATHLLPGPCYPARLPEGVRHRRTRPPQHLQLAPGSPPLLLSRARPRHWPGPQHQPGHPPHCQWHWMSPGLRS